MIPALKPVNRSAQKAPSIRDIPVTKLPNQVVTNQQCVLLAATVAWR
jgi:hypothetical protein